MITTHSTASIQHALSLGGAFSKTNESAVSILWDNAATELFFRSTDYETARRVANLCPRRPGLSAVIETRPLAGLAPGECYAALADGRFERRRLAPFTLDAPHVRARSKASAAIEID